MSRLFRKRSRKSRANCHPCSDVDRTRNFARPLTDAVSIAYGLRIVGSRNHLIGGPTNRKCILPKQFARQSAHVLSRLPHSLAEVGSTARAFLDLECADLHSPGGAHRPRRVQPSIRPRNNAPKAPV